MVEVLTNRFTRNNYIFMSWNTAADGSGISDSPGQQFQITGDVVLYAIWKEKSGGHSGGGIPRRILQYESNGGTKYKDEQYIKNVVVQLNKPIREPCVRDIPLQAGMLTRS